MACGHARGKACWHRRVRNNPAKRLELLHEIAPAAKSIGYLYDPTNPAVEEPSIKALETAARTLGLRLVTARAVAAGEIGRAFAMLVGEGIGALLSGALVPWTDQITALATHYALPAMYPFRQMVDAGGLISYEGDRLDAARLAGTSTQPPNADHPLRRRSTRARAAGNCDSYKAASGA
jgi:putative ABC transport system substrate-binding protein